jgi:hypothetical protein
VSLKAMVENRNRRQLRLINERWKCERGTSRRCGTCGADQAWARITIDFWGKRRYV